MGWIIDLFISVSPSQSDFLKNLPKFSRNFRRCVEAEDTSLDADHRGCPWILKVFGRSKFFWCKVHTNWFLIFSAGSPSNKTGTWGEIEEIFYEFWEKDEICKQPFHWHTFVRLRKKLSNKNQGLNLLENIIENKSFLLIKLYLNMKFSWISCLFKLKFKLKLFC